MPAERMGWGVGGTLIGLENRPEAETHECWVASRTGGQLTLSLPRRAQAWEQACRAPFFRRIWSFYKQADRGLHPTGEEASWDAAPASSWSSANKPKAHKSPCKQLTGPGARGMPS